MSPRAVHQIPGRHAAMTLITYSSRVHFADGVLEEALRSELESNGHRRPLIVAETSLAGSELEDRILEGLPRRTNAALLELSADADDPDEADRIATQYEAHRADVILAVGSRRAIELTRKARARIAISRRGRAANTPSARWRADFFAVPGADGLPSPRCAPSERETTVQGADLAKAPPDVLFCDPTVTLGADLQKSVSAAVCALARTLEAYLSNAFNPPADGIAADGLARVVANLPALLQGDTLDTRRELMAADLNGMLALQKGRGTAQTLADALTLARGRALDEGSVLRLTLPGAMSLVEGGLAGKEAMLRQILRADDRTPLHVLVARFLDPVPLPPRLSDLNISPSDLERAARNTAETSNMATLRAGVNADTFLTLMRSVY